MRSDPSQQKPRPGHVLHSFGDRRDSQILTAGQLIVLESTTYPGTTDELIVPELESSGLKVGKDFFVAFSPERIDPGNASFNTHNTPKIVGGITAQCTEIARLFYSQFIERVIPVSSSKCAEMVKLLENTFRSVNIGMVNELAQMCDLLGVDVYEVIDAAATKPFGFIPFLSGSRAGRTLHSDRSALLGVETQGAQLSSPVYRLGG